MRGFIKISLVITLVLAFAAVIGYATEKEITETFNAKKVVNINTVSGNCIITKGGGDKITVRVVYDIRPEDNFDCKFRERERSLELTERFRGSARGESAWYVTVPDGTRIRFETASGSFEIADFDGEWDVSTASGDIKAERCKGLFEFSTASGEVEVTDCNGEFDLSSASGDVVITNCTGAFEASSASGNVEGEGVVLEDASGFSSASGSASVSLGKSPDVDLNVSSASGRAILSYGGNSMKGVFLMTCSADHGRIDCPYDFEDERFFHRGREEYVERAFTLGAAEPEISVGTASGKAVLKK